MNDRRWPAALMVPLLVLIALLLIIPLVVLTVQSFSSGHGNLETANAGEGRWTLHNYVQIWTDPALRKALVHSILMSAGVAAVSTLLCLPPAWLFVRKEFPGKRTMRALFTIPMSFSGIIVGFLMVIMLGRIGFIPQMSEKLFGQAWLSGLSYQFWGLALAYLYFEIPRATLTLESALRKFDFRLEAAARTLGASPLQRFFLVLVPIMRPALLSTFAITFSVSLGSFGVALIVSKRFSVLGLEIYQTYTGMNDTTLASAMSMVLVVIALAVNLSMRWAFELEEPAHA